MQDEGGKFGRQFRAEGMQVAKVPEHFCMLSLEEWGDHSKDVHCQRCKKKRRKPQGVQHDSIRCWTCDSFGCEEGFVMCLSCLPVVLRTELRTWDDYSDMLF